MRPSRLTFSNGITRMRAGGCARRRLAPAARPRTRQRRASADSSRRDHAASRCDRAGWPSASATLQHAGRLAGAAAGDHFGARAEVEQRQQPRERGRVEAAERVRHRLAHRAEDRRAHVDAGRAAPQPRDRAAAAVAAADEPPRQPQQQPAAQPRPAPPSGSSRCERRHRLHRPLGGVLAGARRDHLVRVAFLPQEAEHRVERREPDRALAQPFGVQPVLVERRAGSAECRRSPDGGWRRARDRCRLRACQE